MTKEEILYAYISLYALRVSAVFLLIFGLRTLISFYKYNIRMADFYHSISMSILLAGVRAFNTTKFKELSEVMRSEKIDFEKQPGFVPEDVIALVKDLKGMKDAKE